MHSGQQIQIWAQEKNVLTGFKSKHRKQLAYWITLSLSAKLVPYVASGQRLAKQQTQQPVQAPDSLAQLHSGVCLLVSVYT